MTTLVLIQEMVSTNFTFWPSKWCKISSYDLYTANSGSSKEVEADVPTEAMISELWREFFSPAHDPPSLQSNHSMGLAIKWFNQFNPATWGCLCKPSVKQDQETERGVQSHSWKNCSMPFCSMWDIGTQTKLHSSPGPFFMSVKCPCLQTASGWESTRKQGHAQLAYIMALPWPMGGVKRAAGKR
jgi:hypothetical protein